MGWTIASTIIAFVGFVYLVAKDIKKRYSWKEGEPLLVDINCPQIIQLEKEGYKTRWANPGNVERYKLKGYEIMIHENKEKRIRQHIENRSGAVLLGKKETPES